MSARRPVSASESSPLPSLGEVTTGSPSEVPVAPPHAIPSAGAIRVVSVPPTPGAVPQTGASRSRAVAVAGGVAAAIAGIALVPREAPVCGDRTRGGELDAHGAALASHIARLEVTRALREIGLALGWIAHGTTSPGLHPAGTPVPVAPTPPAPPAPEPPGMIDGAEGRVGPMPPPTPQRAPGARPPTRT